MESTSSLPCTQQPATCPYSQPDWSIPCPHVKYFNNGFNFTIHLVQRLKSSFLFLCFLFTIIYIYNSPHLYHIHYPSSPPLFHHLKNTWSVHIVSLQAPIISSLSCSSSAPYSQMPSNYLLLNVNVQVYVLITITTTVSVCININSDVSCVFYMILLHAEGGWRKPKVTTNQHLSCTLKTSQC